MPKAVPYYPVQRSLHGLHGRGLGDATSPSSSTVVTANAAANAILKSSGLTPSSGITQTNTGKDAQLAEKFLGVEATLVPIAIYALAIPPPAGEVAAAALGAAIIAAKVLDGIAGTDADKATYAKAGQVNLLNATLRNQILQVDQQTDAVSAGLQQLQTALQSQGFSGFDCPCNLGGILADSILANANASNATLQAALNQKVATLTSLINNFNSTVTQVYNVITGKSSAQKIFLYGIIGLVIAAIGYGLISSQSE